MPWRIKCRRLVDHVCSVFSFGSDNWSLTIQTMDRIKRMETKIMMRLFPPKEVRMKHGSNSIKDAAERPGRFGYIWAYLFCMTLLMTSCGELWDGYVIRDCFPEAG